MSWALICMVHLAVCSYHTTYTFQSESTLYSFVNAKELFAKSRGKIWILSDSNLTRTHNHLVHKRTLNHLANIVWLNRWVFIYELSGCGFKSSCCQLNFSIRACFEQGVPWHSCNYGVWIHSVTRTWHDKRYSQLFLFVVEHSISLTSFQSNGNTKKISLTFH